MPGVAYGCAQALGRLIVPVGAAWWHGRDGGLLERASDDTPIVAPVDVPSIVRCALGGPP
jgi:hypothetical protein